MALENKGSNPFIYLIRFLIYFYTEQIFFTFSYIKLFFFFNKSIWINFFREGFLIDYIQKDVFDTFVLNWIIKGSLKLNLAYFNKLIYKYTYNILLNYFYFFLYSNTKLINFFFISFFIYIFYFILILLLF